MDSSSKKPNIVAVCTLILAGWASAWGVFTFAGYDAPLKRLQSQVAAFDVTQKRFEASQQEIRSALDKAKVIEALSPQIELSCSLQSVLTTSSSGGATRLVTIAVKLENSSLNEVTIDATIIRFFRAELPVNPLATRAGAVINPPSVPGPVSWNELLTLAECTDSFLARRKDYPRDPETKSVPWIERGSYEQQMLTGDIHRNARRSDFRRVLVADAPVLLCRAEVVAFINYQKPNGKVHCEVKSTVSDSVFTN